MLTHKKISHFTLFRFTAYIAVFLFITGCAQMLPLSGGEKDVTPPKIVSQEPQNKTTSFNGKEIVVEFDEYVQLRDVQNQLIITPRLKNQPDVNVAGKRLVLRFKDPLEPATTYNINFGSAVSDVHEGNVLSGLNIIFSTGTYIDSLTVSGHITDAFTQKSAADITVMLYLNGDDSCMFKQKPDYFSKSDKMGNYTIPYIRAGKYKAVAVGDKNKNFIYDSGEELADMIYTPDKNLVKVDSNLKLDFKVFKEEPPKLFVRRTLYPGYGRAVFAFNKAFYGSLRFDTGVKEKVNYFFNDTRDTLFMQYFRGGEDTIAFILQGPDDKIAERLQLIKQSGERFEKDLQAGKLKPKIYGISQLQAQDFFSVSTNSIFSGDSVITKNTNASVDPTRFIFITSKDTLRFSYPVTVKRGRYTLKTEKVPEEKGQFVFYPGAFSGYEQQTNDTTRINYEWKTAEEFGTIKFSLTFSQNGFYVLEMLNDRGIVHERIKIDATKSLIYKTELKWIPPGNYTFRMIKDEDEDGKWTSGDLLNRKKPETMYYNDKAMKLLADWEMNLSWTIE